MDCSCLKALRWWDHHSYFTVRRLWPREGSYRKSQKHFRKHHRQDRRLVPQPLVNSRPECLGIFEIKAKLTQASSPTFQTPAILTRFTTIVASAHMVLWKQDSPQFREANKFYCGRIMGNQNTNPDDLQLLYPEKEGIFGTRMGHKILGSSWIINMNIYIGGSLEDIPERRPASRTSFCVR